MTAKQIGKRIKAKGLGRLKWYCQMCQKQCRDENGFKCHQTGESHLRQMELFSQNPEHYLNKLSDEFEETFLKLLSRRFNTTQVKANKVYNEYIQDKEHSHMNATKWETLSGFVQYLGRTGKVKVEENEKGLYITWIDRNPEALARAEKNARKERDTLGDMALNEKIMKQRLATAKAAGIGSSASATARDNTVAGVRVDADGNIVLGMGGGGSGGGSSSSSASRKRSAPDSRPTLMFGGGSSSSSSSSSSSTLAKAAAKAAAEAEVAGQKARVAAEAAAQAGNNSSLLKAKPTISFELPPSKRTKYDDGGAASSSEPRSTMWMCECLVVKIKNKTVGGGVYYKKKARILKCNVDMLTADVRVLASSSSKSSEDDSTAGTKIRISQKDLETVIPKPNLSEERSRVMLLRGQHRGMTGTLIKLNVKRFTCAVKLDDGSGQTVKNIEYEDVSKVLMVDPYKKSKKKKSKKKSKR